MTVTTYKWTIERYHRAIEAGIFDDTLLGERAKIRDAKPVTLPNNSEPAPDIAIVKPLGAVYLEHHPYPEDIFWIIEFSNATLNKDLGEKKEIYPEAGITEYWVVNLKDRRLQVFRDLNNGQYKTELTLTKRYNLLKRLDILIYGGYSRLRKEALS